MVKTSKRAYLYRFKVNGNAGFILEFGNKYLRLYANHGQMLNNDLADAYELETPYSLEDIWDADMECYKLQFAQKGDVLYIFHPKYMKKLVRYANDNWKLEDWELLNGPFGKPNTSEITIKSNGTSGIVELTASGSVFKADDVGRLIRLNLVNDQSTAWQAEKEVNQNDIWTSDGKYYQAMNSGTTGNVKPVHSEGRKSDGAINWQYVHSGYGVAKIKEYVNESQVKAEVAINFPKDIETDFWELGMIRPGVNYPMSGCFFLNRFWLLITADDGLKAIGSYAGDFNNFADQEHGEVVAECAITVPIDSKEYNEGRWIACSDALFVGTSSGEFYIDKANSGEAMTTDNVVIKPISYVGSKPITPIAINGHLLFIDRFGTSIRDLAYSLERDGYDPFDTTILGRHLLKSGIVDWDWQDIPNKILWLATADGRAITFTFDTQQQVAAISQQYLSGSVESVAVIPSPNERRDDVWVVVKRKIGNTLKRYVEWIDEGTRYEYSDDVDSISDYKLRDEAENDYIRDTAFYVDSGIIYNRVSGDLQTVLPGLSHLAGCEVAISANGMERPHQIVSDEGTIEIKETDTKVVVGLPIRSSLKPQFIYLGSDSGNGMAAVQRIDHLYMMVYRSGGGRYGDSEDNMLDILYHTSDEIVGQDVKLFSGTVEMLWNGGSSLIRDNGASILIENSSVYPMHILAMIPSMTSSR